MNILLINQVFHPDVVSTAQHLTSLAMGLVHRGHHVRIISSRNPYEKAEHRYARHEVWNGIHISRVSHTRLGKGSKVRRAIDFITFALGCFGRLLMEPKPDVVVSLSTPPLISTLAALYARVRGCPFCYWVMDLNPDEAIAVGWLKADSLAARILEWMSRFSLRSAARIVALDRFMKERIQQKDIPAEKIEIVLPWAYENAVRHDAQGARRFRDAHGLGDRFVVMYSGNHSPCHPLDSLLEAARLMRDDVRVAFCFVGGGSEFPKVKAFAARHQLANMVCLPYQPLDQLSQSLSAADLHVVVMGERLAGIVHPCKVYNAMLTGAHVLYIGPRPSHVTDLAERFKGMASIHEAPNGDPKAIVHAIGQCMENKARVPAEATEQVARAVGEEAVLPHMFRTLESLAKRC